MCSELGLVSATGILHYENMGKFYKLVLNTDQGIADFYRAQVPRWIAQVKPQKYRAHISIVRKEIPRNLDAWGKYEGERVEFLYSRIVQNDDNYWWLNVFCKRFEEIRLELGLPVTSPYTLPPDGFKKCFHLTTGNTKAVT